jgi:MFS family permease
MFLPENRAFINSECFLQSMPETEKQMTRTNTHSTGTTVLIILIIVFTFPLWIGILGGLFGLAMGLFGAVIGIIAGVFGAIIGGIAALFGGLFHWGWHSHFVWNALLATLLVVAIVKLAKSGK